MRYQNRLSVLPRSGALAVLLVLGSACSPAVYKEEIGELAAAIEKTETTFAELRTQEHEATIEVNARYFLSFANAQLNINYDCARGVRQPCGLVMVTGDGTRVFPDETIGQEATKLLAQLTKYAKGLEAIAIAGAEDAEAVNEAAGKAGTAISGLASAVGGSSDIVTARVGAVESVFKWLVGAYVDQKRYNALRDAINKADPLVKRAGASLREEMVLFWTLAGKSKVDRLDVGIEDLGRKAVVASSSGAATPSGSGAMMQATNGAGKASDAEVQHELREHERFALLKELAAESDSLQAWNAADPGVLVDKLVAAHSDLAEAINDPTEQAEAVFKSLGDFAEQIEKIRDALKSS